ncbi:MAG: CBS domain-containing protein [Archaeoglobi archaeon]|nr:CBS domain-containing protein [Archaeoglobi archaeon]
MLPPVEYIARIKPFSLLTDEEVEELVSKMHVSLYKTGKTVFKRNKVLDRIYLVRDGEIGLFDGDDLVEVVGKNEFTGLISAIKKEKTEFEARAITDTICFEFKAKDVQDFMERNEEFAEFVNKLLTMRFSELFRGEEDELINVFSKKVSEILSKRPVTCSPDSTMEEVVRLMSDENVGSVVVTNPRGNPIGIITHTDVVRSLARGLDLSTKAESIMSHPVKAVDVSASLLDAYIKFIENAVNHLAVAEDGKLVGVVTIKDLIRKFEPQTSLLNYPKLVKKAENPERVRELLQEVVSSMKNMARSGLSYEVISSIYVPILDQILRKLVEGADLDATVAIIGSFGRREVRVPIRYDLAVIEGDASGLAYDFVSVRRYTDLAESVEGLTALADSRYIHGDGARYVSFREELEERLERLKGDVAKLLKSLLSQRITIENCDEVVCRAARLYAILQGDFTSKSTVERIGEMDLSEDVIESTVEAYSAVRMIRLRRELFEKSDKVDEVILKKSVGIFRQFQEELSRRMKSW